MEARKLDAASGGGNRRLLMLGLALVFIGAGAGWAFYWNAIGQFGESTDDAYVAGNLVQVTAQVAGTAVEIRADETELVRQGEPLVVLDNADAMMAMERAKAELAETVRQVRQFYERSAQLQANVTLRETDLLRVRDDLKRREAAIGDGSISLEELEHARSQVVGAKAALALAQHEARAAGALVDGTSLARHPSVERAKTRLREAYLGLARASVPAPVTGYVAKRSVQVGQRITPGMALMAVVPLEQIWADANFKEGQLQHLRIGQPVEVRSDIYGEAITYKGKVVGLGMGTGSAFSLLPPQNATGNWIKVVQRVPVRVALDREQLQKYPLRIGLSLEVQVDTHDRSGAVLAQAAVRDKPAYATPVFGNAAIEADKLAERIIRAHSAAPAGEGAAARN
jgi:membrane fusion protein (multidrug efflux system)